MRLKSKMHVTYSFLNIDLYTFKIVFTRTYKSTYINTDRNKKNSSIKIIHF